MRGLAAIGLLVVTVAACNASPGLAPTEPPATASAGPSAVVTAAASPPAASAPQTPRPSQSFKAGPWPPEWQLWICAAREQMLRQDALAGSTAGEDAATRAISDLKSTQINWDPGADLRALVGKAAFILLDAAPRGGNAMDDVPPAIKLFERAYSDLKDATGFECPGG